MVAVQLPTKIVKRSGEVVDFDVNKIRTAMTRCYMSIHPYINIKEMYGDQINTYVERVVNVIGIRYTDENPPCVENVQDIVEFVLQAAGEFEAAKHYIIYRHEHTKQREANYIPQDVLDAFESDKKYFPTELQRFQFYDKYSRWNEIQNRRETWEEATQRTGDFLGELADNQKDGAVPKHIIDEIIDAIRRMGVMPSMRLMSMAGPAARRDNASLYNCCYTVIDSIDSIVEVMALSMAGCGVGYSVESKYVQQLPEISVAHEDNACDISLEIDDSAEGWCYALRMGLNYWIGGCYDIKFDYSKIRPAGSILKTKGGRASGPEPLRGLLSFISERIRRKAGKRLTTLDVHDIVCAIGNAVVSGGVRRTALIALFDEDDMNMLTCKDGNFAEENPQRWNANNSAVWSNPVDMSEYEFLKRIFHMVESQRGEPGIFSRDVAKDTMPATRNQDHDFGCNPCGEIILRPNQMCNLSAVVARSTDTLDTLRGKVRLATIIGTIQSCATYFPNIRDIWRQNCEEERLLGVDITGQMDCPVLREPGVLQQLQMVAVKTNEEWAKRLGINKSAAITCVKPSGNTSVLVDCSSGLHPRWAPYYIRNVRVAATSPLAKVLADSGYVMNPENGQDPQNPTTWVVSFPVKSPYKAHTRKDVSALQQFEWWYTNKLCWTEHNPSVTITYTPDEVLRLTQAMYEKRSHLGGITILPRDDADYDQLPYIEITEDQYYEMLKTIKPIQMERLYLYEKQDNTTVAQEVACTTGLCEL